MLILRIKAFRALLWLYQEFYQEIKCIVKRCSQNIPTPLKKLWEGGQCVIMCQTFKTKLKNKDSLFEYYEVIKYGWGDQIK